MELSYGNWKLGARQQAILCNTEMQWIYVSYTTSLKNNSELWLAVFAVEETEKLSLNKGLSSSFTLALSKSLYFHKYAPLYIF